MIRLLVLLVMLACPLFAVALDIHGVTLAERTDVGGHSLVLNGGGTRTKIVFKVYVGSLYLPQPAKDLGGVLAQSPRRIRMDLLRNLSADQLSDALLGGLKDNNSDAQLAAIKDETGQMVAAMEGFGDVRKGSVVTLDFIDGATRIALDDKLRATIPGAAFNDALTRVWLGAKPVQADLKAAMLGAAAN
ncbi:MAG: chalcone isomerase family protein [Casimicrobiaceae bacterium]